jgi:hypothetical protein
MPISKEEFTKFEDAIKRLSVKNMGEVTSNSEVIPDILLIEEINAEYDAELKALEQQESIIDEKTLEGFSSEEDLAKAFGVKPLEQSKNLEELTKEELWKELVDLGYDSYESLEEYESFIKDFGIKGTIEETLIQTIKNNKTEEKDSFIDLSLNKILKDNNITKNC